MTINGELSTTKVNLIIFVWIMYFWEFKKLLLLMRLLVVRLKSGQTDRRTDRQNTDQP